MRDASLFPLREVSCRSCGTTFETNNGSHWFCSAACRYTQPCVTCGRPKKRDARECSTCIAARRGKPNACAKCGVGISARAKTCRNCVSRRMGPDHPLWRSGRYIDNGGYARIIRRDHPRSCNGYVLEHIVVMEEVLGRSLLPSENVHHRNGVKYDNRPENLELWSTAQPKGQRIVDKVAWAKWLLATYLDDDGLALLAIELFAMREATLVRED